jgi:hypothetical protein
VIPVALGCLVDPGLTGPGPVLQGKVRDTWHLPGGRSAVVTTDALHLIEALDDNTALIETLRMIPVEVVMRRYLTGSTSTSIWKLYKAGQREFGGRRLPDGMRKNEELETVVTPTTKAPVGRQLPRHPPPPRPRPRFADLLARIRAGIPPAARRAAVRVAGPPT